jgi:hypothetical protein
VLLHEWLPSRWLKHTSQHASHANKLRHTLQCSKQGRQTQASCVCAEWSCSLTLTCSRVRCRKMATMKRYGWPGSAYVSSAESRLKTWQHKSGSSSTDRGKSSQLCMVRWAALPKNNSVNGHRALSPAAATCKPGRGAVQAHTGWQKRDVDKATSPQQNRQLGQHREAGCTQTMWPWLCRQAAKPTSAYSPTCTFAPGISAAFVRSHGSSLWLIPILPVDPRREGLMSTGSKPGTLMRRDALVGQWKRKGTGSSSCRQNACVGTKHATVSLASGSRSKPPELSSQQGRRCIAPYVQLQLVSSSMP